MELTKDATKLICTVYKSFLEKRKSGESKANAKHFEPDYYKTLSPISSWSDADIMDTLAELKRAGFLKLYINGGFQLNDEAIIFMEKRFKNGLVEVSDFISKFIP